MIKYLSKQERFESLQKLYTHAQKSPFYKNRFPNGALKEIESWQKLPLLEKQELFDNAYPRSSDMLTTPLEDAIILSTGGSSGIARYTLMSHSEWELFGQVQADTFKLLGVKKDDKVANLFIAGHLWPSFLGVHEIIKKIGAVHLPISANIEIKDIMQLCVEFQPSVMVSLPTLFVFLADMAKKENIKFTNLRMILYAGEQMSEQAQAHVKKYLGVEKITALAYSSADAGLMGYKCDECGEGVYHLPSDFQYMEIVDEKTSQVVDDGKVGDIVVTNLKRYSMPIMRYKIGDIGNFITHKCPCGDPNPLFHLGGRSGDDFKLGGAFISMDIFEDSIASFDNYLSMNYTVSLEDIREYMIITLHVESPEPKVAQEKIGSSLREMIISKVRDIKVGLELGYIREFAVKFVELGSLTRNPRTGKVKRLNDKRIK